MTLIDFISGRIRASGIVMDEFQQNIVDEFQNTVTGNDSYLNTETYNTGDIVVYDGKIYKCITPISTPEDFNAAKWSRINLKSIVDGKESYTLVKDGINIKLVGSNGTESSVEESVALKTTEHVVGTWINDKPIYSKTFTLTPTSSGEVNFTINDFPSNVGLMWFDKTHTFLVTSTGLIVHGSGASSNDAYTFDSRIINIANNRLYFYAGASIYSGSTIYATVEYTKTTD